MTRIGIVLGSTRPGRGGEMVARWVEDVARRHAHDDTTFEVVDLADHSLPLLDEPLPAIFSDYRAPHTRRWADTIGSFDGFVFVTPEYNHSVPAALNAIDFLFAEWSDKEAGFVSYGFDGGTRAVEHLRLVLAELQVAGVRTQVALSLRTEFELDDPIEPGVFSPGPHQEPNLTRMLEEILDWSRALAPLRASDADRQSVPA
ncbi:MAG: NAD(P)H-dependent oxidoreductase [Actinomycetota bacterium]|nr:NAD(P)H-dependent oxidoreductase [Actinomycetota bacterium]